MVDMVMLNFLPSKEETLPKPVVTSAARKPDAKSGTKTSTEAATLDPWADFRTRSGLPLKDISNANGVHASGSQSSTQPRVTEGPIEQRFLQQDQQIETLKKAMQGIQATIDGVQASQNAFQTTVDSRFNTMEKDVSNQIKLLGVTFENTVTTAMRKQDKQLSDSLAEIKSLFAQTAPVPGTPGKKARLTPRANDEDEHL